MRRRDDRVRERLLGAGLSSDEAVRKTELWLAARQATGGLSAEGVREYFVPGRIEVLGKHTDYAGGRSLLCAAERGFVVAARPRDDDRVTVTDVVTGVRDEFGLSLEQAARSHWQNYPATVVRRLARNFGGALRGADLAFGSDLPRAAGLSSSTALVMAVALALLDRNAIEDDARYRAEIARDEELAGYLATIENGRSFGTLAGDTGVGTRGGCQDHTAILCARAGHLVGYEWSPSVRESKTPLARDYLFVVASSGIAASKTGAVRERYNRNTAVAGALLDLWFANTGRRHATLGELVRETPEAVERVGAMLDAGPAPDGFEGHELVARLEQFTLETGSLVPGAVAALAAGDLAAFGAQVARSQEAAEVGLRNQIPETVTLVRLARELGAVAASAFGAGFGGSVWALVPQRELDRFMAGWRVGYAARHPEAAARAEMFATRAGPPMLRL